MATGTIKYAKRQTPKDGAKRTAADTIPIDGDQPTTEKERRDDIRDALATMVNGYIKEAINARSGSGIEQEWNEAYDLWNGVDDLSAPVNGMEIRDKNSRPTDSRGSSDGGGASIVVNITKPKTKVATSRTKELLVPNNERPFDVKPSPVPDLDEVTRDEEMAGQLVTLKDGTQAPALAVVEMMRSKAAEAAKQEADWIEDRFVEGSVYNELRQIIDDAGILGTGVLKGPIALDRTTRRWEAGPDGVYALTISSKPEPTSLRVRVQDCFPDPSCGNDIHNGSFFAERDYMSQRQLRKLAKDPGYNSEAIADALLEGPMTYAMMSASETRERRNPGEMARTSALYEVWYCYCDCSPDFLIAMGVKDDVLGNLDEPEGANVGTSTDAAANIGTPTDDEEGDEEDSPDLSSEQKAALASIPAVVTMVNGRPVKAAIEPLSSGDFPYDFFPWERIDGQPYGKGVPMQMRAAQIIVKQGVRRMLENGGLSAGPQIAITRGALTPANNKYEITGRKLWYFEPTELIADINKAMAMFEIPSAQNELLGIIKFGLEMADMLSMVPLLMHGDEQPGASPETLGGLRMFENNAMSPLRDIAKLFDDSTMIPHLGRYHDWWMEHVPDKPKGDSEIQALGSTALIKREEGRQFLLQLYPAVKDPDMRINPDKYRKELARAHGYDMGLIEYTEDEWKEKQKQMASQPPPVAPQVEAAQIRAKTQADADVARGAQAEKALLAKAQDSQLDREMDRALKDLDYEIEQMRLAGDQNISLAQVKAMLAAKAGELTSKREEMSLKLSPQNPSGLGI